MNGLKGRLPSGGMVVAVIALIAAVSGVAYAANKVDGKDLINGTVTSKKINNKTLMPIDFSNKAKERFQGQQGQRGNRGPRGNRGQQGPPGQPGADGTATYENPQWGIIARNHIGSAVAELRGGPFGSFNNEDAPPYGEGSLQISVSDNALSGGTPQEKASFGNEVDFFGDNIQDLDEVGFHVFTTGENYDNGEPMPNINIEIDPNLDANPTSHYSTLVFLPENSPENQWSDYIDGTSSGEWYLTGPAGTATGCNQATLCTFDEVKAALDDGSPDATIFSIAVTKGRDSAFVGAVDGLRINESVFDFEPFGVKEVPAE